MNNRLRIVSFNAAIQDIRLLGRSIYCPVAWPRERLRHVPEALLALEADVLCLQEMFHRPLQDWLCRQMASRYPHVAGLARPGPAFRLGNELLVLSRHPMADARLFRFREAAPEERSFTNRGFLHVRVDVPGLGSVNLINFHTTAGGARAHPESPRMETIRRHQVAQMLDHAGTLPLPLLVGDLNAGPHTSRDIYNDLLARGHVDAFSSAGAEGITWDPANPLVARGGEAHLPGQRIDHVFLSGEIRRRTTPVRACIAMHEHVVPTPGGPMPCSDHYGILTDLHF